MSSVVLWALAVLVPAALEWEAPPECPPAAEIAEALALRLGTSTTTPIQLEARALSLPGGTWRLVLATRGAPDAPRIIEAETCRAIADAAVVLAAMALRAPPSRAPVLAPPDPPTPPSEVPLAVVLRAEGRAALGPLPGPGAALSADLGLRWDRWALDVSAGAQVLLPQSAQVSEGSAAGATLSLIAARAGACWRPELAARLSAGGCLHLELGRLGGEGFGAQTNTTGGALWAAIGAGPALAYELAPGWRLIAGIEAVLPLTRPIFVLDRVGQVHVPGAVGLMAGGGLEIHIR